MKSFRLYFLTYLSLVVRAVGTLGAQTTSLGELVVEADREQRPGVARTVEESRAELALTAGGTEVIDADRYLRGRASTMADTFALSPGVVAQPRFGSDEARLSIRGSGIQRTFHGRGIRLLQDGIPLNLADGSFDMQAVDPLSVDYINVWRGANALAYGASTLGGAIDYRSATGLGDTGASLRLEGGSFDYLRSRIGSSHRVGKADAAMSLSFTSQEGFREHSEQEASRFFGNLGWRIDEHIDTRLFLTAVHSRSQLPGSLTKQELERDPSQADASVFGALAYDYRRDFELYRIASKTRLVNEGLSIDVMASFTYKDLDHPITPFVGVIDQRSNDVILGMMFGHEGELAGKGNLLRGGFFLMQGVIDAANFQNRSGSRGVKLSAAEQTATNLEAFLEEQWVLGAGLTGILGVSAAENRRENEQTLGSAPSYDRDFSHVSPKVGLRWDGPDLQIFGNISGSYEPPSFSETQGAFTPNRAQTADTLEIGTRGRRANARWDATVYHARIENEFLAMNDSAGVPLGTTNADDTLHQGVEVAGEVDLLGGSWEDSPEQRLVARAAWTYGRFEFDDDETYQNHTLAGLPPHLVRGELMWESRGGYYAGPTLEWVPEKAYVDHQNTLAADPYALLGIKFGRAVKDGISWFVEMKNLTDERYAATTGVVANAGPSPETTSRNFLPGDGRSVFCGLEWKW